MNYTTKFPIIVDSGWRCHSSNCFHQYERAIFAAQPLENRIINEIKKSGSPSHNQDVTMNPTPMNGGFVYSFTYSVDSGD